MSFLGPVTRLDGRLVRPHDLIVERRSTPGAHAAVVTRLVRVGFEVRAELDVAGTSVQVIVTRAEARHLELTVGDRVFVRASVEARSGAPTRGLRPRTHRPARWRCGAAFASAHATPAEPAQPARRR